MIFIDFITKNKNGQLKNYKKLYLAFYVKNVAIDVPKINNILIIADKRGSFSRLFS
jgi:hypothetical protein